MAGFRFEIKEQIGVIAVAKNGWKKELNLVSFNGATPKYDIREWDPNHEQMSRGVTFSDSEMLNVYGMLKERFDK